jgi:hypothetical protein
MNNHVGILMKHNHIAKLTQILEEDVMLAPIS